MDDTRMLRNAQANLISAQAVRIATLEARLDAALHKITELEAQKKAAEALPAKGAQA